MPVDRLEKWAHREAVLAFVEAAAASGEPMLTNEKLADALKMTVDKAAWAIRTLKIQGVIRSEMRGGQRRFVISSTGAATGWSRPAKPHMAAKPMAATAVKNIARDRREGRLLDLIRRCAQAGEALPINARIAEDLICADSTLRRDLHCLVLSGLISIETAGNKRRITIVETGEATPWSDGGGGRRCSFVSTVPAPPPEPVAEEAPRCFAPCARYGCADFVALGKAYCAIHETDDVLEWPVVALESVEEDLAA